MKYEYNRALFYVYASLYTNYNPYIAYKYYLTFDKGIGVTKLSSYLFREYRLY